MQKYENQKGLSEVSKLDKIDLFSWNGEFMNFSDDLRLFSECLQSITPELGYIIVTLFSGSFILVIIIC